MSVADRPPRLEGADIGPEATQAGRPSGSIQPASPRGAWPVGLVGMLAIVAATEWSIARRDGDFGTIYSIEWKMNARAIRTHASGSGVLCFGTSVTHMGVAPRVIEETMRTPVYNFAISGAQPFASYVALRDAIAAGSRPKAVVVDFMWTAIGQGYRFNERVLPEMATPLDCAEFALAARDGDFFGRLALSWGLPSYRCRAEVRSNITAAVRGEEPNRNPERLLFARNTATNRGGYHLGGIGFNGEVNPADPVLFPSDWACPPTSEAYIHKFLDLAASRDIPVFWLLTPLAPAAQTHWEASGVKARYTRLVESIRARHPGVTVLDATGAKYDVGAFNDAVHLNRDGAVAFSADVADAIQGRIAGARPGESSWVRLPDYRPDPRASRVEDSRATLARIKDALGKARR